MRNNLANAGVQGASTVSERITFHTHLTIHSNGTVDVDQHISSPERIDTTPVHSGIELIEPIKPIRSRRRRRARK